jgi:hypothetical protein
VSDIDRLGRGPLPAVTSILGGLALLLVVVGVAFAQWRAAEDRASRIELQLQDSNQRIGQLVDQVEGLGAEPVTTAPPSDPVLPVALGPTDAQVRLAVVDYLTRNPPTPGRAPTDIEIQAAVTAYCTARGGCIGPAGDDGRDGQPGVPGATGSTGPGPTDEQVAGDVAAYCDTHGGCVGPPGPAGAPGPAGPSVDACDPPAGYNPIVDPDQPGWTCYTTTTTPPTPP